MPKTIAVGVDKFAYMSSLAIYVYSSQSFLPLAILAKHQQHLSALAMSPYNANLLACAIGNQELRVYDVDTELPVCRTSFTGTRNKASIMEWHRTNPGVILMAIGPHLVAWDFGALVETSGSGGGGGGAATAATAHGHGASGAAAVATAAPPPSPPPSQGPRASMLGRLRAHVRGGGGGGGGGSGSDSAAADPASFLVDPSVPSGGRWVVLRDLGSLVTAFDQCPAAASAAGGGAGGTSAATVVAVATGEGRVVLLELEPSGLAVRCELRSLALPEVGAPGVGPASAVAWEPLSGAGLLLAVGRGGGMALYDSGSGQVVLQYAKQPATATRFAAFLPGQPGNFLLSSSRSGALQLWNVSQPQPLRLLKLGMGLVQGFALLPPGLPGLPRRTTPVLVSFADGSLCVYDLEAQQVLWRQEGGHTETVFDCRFCATDPNLLATASFDSTVRVWDVRTSRCVRILSGGEGILYSVSWSADGLLLAASNDSGAIFLYDYGCGMLIKTLKQHSKQSLRVAFHPQKSTLLASASVDGTVLVYTTDGETVRQLRHSSAVSCLAWGVLCPSLLATTSDTGHLYVWDVSRPADDCLMRTLSKHSSRTFNVQFSPLLQHHLLSSSNDHSARVWDVSTGDCLAVLQGHVAEVRAVAWHPEVAHICFTGSWDAAVRVWDIRTSTCLHVATDHVADVYGIAVHPQRPFFLVTCSRDTTLRLWSTLELTPGLLPQALVRALPQLRLPAKEALALPPGAPPCLSGPCSQELAERLAAPSCTPLERFAAITEFFMPPACVDVFWDIVRCAKAAADAGPGAPSGAGPGAVSSSQGRVGRQRPVGSDVLTGGGGGGGGLDDGTSLHHWTTAPMAVASTANHLELAAFSKSARGAATSGGPPGSSSRREELLRSAAQQHLLAGNVEHCCELLADLGDWDRALALAPVVGLRFWQRLMRQRVEALAEAETQSHVSDVLPLYLVSEQVPALVGLLSSSYMYDTAFNVAAVHACGGYQALACGTAGNGDRRGRGEYGNGVAADGAVEPPPPLQSPSLGSAAAASAVPAPPPPPPLPISLSGLDLDRPACSTDLPANATAGLTSSSYGGGVSPSSLLPSASLPLPLAGSVTSSSSAAAAPPGPTLPPVNVRGGALPSLARAPSLRPPPLAPVQSPAGAPPPSAGTPPPGSTAAAPSPFAVRVDTSVTSPRASASAGGLLDLPPALSQPQPSTSPRMGGMATGAAAAAAAAAASSTPPFAARRPSSAAQARGRYDSATAATAAAATTGGGGCSGPRPSDRDAFGRAVAVRLAQARTFLSQGLPLQAASCALSVDDVPGAVGLLLRGGQEEMALALVAGLTRPVPSVYGGGGGDGGPALLGFGVGIGTEIGGGGEAPAAAGLESVAATLRPRVLAAAAQRREAAGDYLTAAELLKQVPGRNDLRELLAGRCRAHAAPSLTSKVFSALGLEPPATYGPLGPAPEPPASTPAPPAPQRQKHGGSADGEEGALAAEAGWDGVRRLLLGGQQSAAAEGALAGVRRLVAAGERVTLTSPAWEQAWAAINSLCASALGGRLWAQVFCHAAYLGALVALEQGCVAVGLYLVRALEAFVAGREDAELPVSQARLAAEVSEALDACLALPAYGGGWELGEALAELAAAPQGSPWLQGLVQARIAAADPTPAAGSGPASPPSSARGQRSAANGGEGPLSSPPSSLARRLAALSTAAAGGGGGSGGSSLRLGGQEVNSSIAGRLSVAAGSSLAASLSASIALTSAGPAGARVGTGRSGAGGAGLGSGAGSSNSNSSSSSSSGLVGLARGPVVVAAAHVPSRSLRGTMALPTSAVSGGVIRGAAVVLDDGQTRVSLSEAVALRRAMAYSPLGSGKLLVLP